MDLHEDALNKILGDMDGMEANKMKGGATITITVSPAGGEEDSSDDMNDLPADHDIGMCGGGCAYHKGGLVQGTEGAADAENLAGVPKLSEGGEIESTSEGLAADFGLAEGGEVLPQLAPGHDSLECKGKCPVHMGGKGGAQGKKGLSMAAGGQVPATPVPAEVDDMRVPPFLRKKKMV